jgi:hypothetical protein
MPALNSVTTCADAPPHSTESDASMQPRRIRQGLMNGVSPDSWFVLLAARWPLQRRGVMAPAINGSGTYRSALQRSSRSSSSQGTVRINIVADTSGGPGLGMAPQSAHAYGAVTVIDTTCLPGLSGSSISQ